MVFFARPPDSKISSIEGMSSLEINDGILDDLHSPIKFENKEFEETQTQIRHK